MEKKAVVKLLRISAPHFVAGIEPNVRAAPIIYYMLSWSEERIRQYCASKRWEVEDVE